jgi:O-antigen ligase
MGRVMTFAKELRLTMGSKIESAVFYGLLVIILLTSIPNGTVDAWLVSMLVFLVFLAVAMRVIEAVLTQRFALAEPLMLSPLIGILLLTGYHYYSSAGSANRYEIREFFLTFLAITLLLETLFRYTTKTKRLSYLIYVVIIVGMGSALFGLVRQMFRVDELFLVKLAIGPNAGYGQFINRNHFAFLMEMTIGLLIGLALQAKLSDIWKLLSWVAIGTISLATILVNSRGAIVSILAQGVFAVFLFFVVRRSGEISEDLKNPVERPAARNLKAIVVSLMVAAIFLVVGFFTVALIGGDSVANRIESIKTEVQVSEDKKVRRREIWQSTWELIKENRVAGVGFGVYSSAITKFDKANGNWTLEQAHNDYLEVLAGGGIIAFSFLLAFLALVIRRVRKRLRYGSPLERASCFGSAIGIFGIMLHSFVDFGLHVMINSLLLIVLIVIACAKFPRTDEIAESN